MNLPVREGESPKPPSSGRTVRRDSMPLWVIVLLIFFIGMRILEICEDNPGGSSLMTKHASPSRQEGAPDTDTIQDFLETDLQTKIAFVKSYAEIRPSVNPDQAYLRVGLKAALQLQKESANAPAAARRVIILRSLLKLPPFAIAKGGQDPLLAFTKDLPSADPKERLRYQQEAQMWRIALGGGRLTAPQLAAIAAQMQTLPNIRWWRYPGMTAVLQRQGNAGANRYAAQAREHALNSLLPAVVLGLMRVGLLLVGFFLLVYFLYRGYVRRTNPNTADSGDLWPTLPEPIPFEARRLGAGDLMGIFVIFLLSREVIGMALTGFSGFGAPHYLHFGGLLTPYRHRVELMSAARRTLILVTLESAVYILSAVPSFAALWHLARRRGASLADEIGWNRRNFGLNILYGLGGYGVALPLMLIAAKVAPQIFKHVPAPSNPVIPQIMNASGFWTPLILTVLASVIAPIVEEFLFRGVFYQAAKLRLGVWPAIILTGVVFGFVHPVGIAEMLAIAALGGVFAWMAETRKSLLPSMIAHGVNNFTTTILLLFVLSQ